MYSSKLVSVYHQDHRPIEFDLIGIDFKDAPKTYIQLVATKRLNVDVKEFQTC